MSDLFILIVLAVGIVLGAYLPDWARRLAGTFRRFRFRPRLVRRHRLNPTSNPPSNV